MTAKVFENQSEGALFVDLSVNKNESFQVGDHIKVTILIVQFPIKLNINTRGVL